MYAADYLTLQESVEELTDTTQRLTRELGRDANLREITLFVLALAVTALMLSFALTILIVARTGGAL